MKESDDYYDIDESFPVLMATCVKYMRESLNSRFKKAGYSITTEQWAVLIHLQQQDGLSQQSLANRFDRSKVSALNLIKKLEESGHIIRRPDPVDGRSNRVYLTSKGRKIQKELIPLARKNIAYMSEGVSSDEIEILKHLVRRITSNLKR